jgi:hypothetical protein
MQGQHSHCARLDAKAVIHCKACSTSVESAQLRIECQEETLTVPITAYPPSPAFQVDRTKIDFGTVLIQSSQIQRFSLKNCGTIEGKFTIPFDYQFLSIEPQSGLLPATESTQISLTFRAHQTGDYPFSMTPKVEGNYYEIESIVGLAKVVDHSIVLTDAQTRRSRRSILAPFSSASGEW